MEQRLIDDLSDLLQCRDSEHRAYPYGHPKYCPPADAVLPCVPGGSVSVTVYFGSDEECESFFHIFRALNPETRKRTINHLHEIGTIALGG